MFTRCQVVRVRWACGCPASCLQRASLPSHLGVSSRLHFSQQPAEGITCMLLLGPGAPTVKSHGAGIFKDLGVGWNT